MTKPCPIFFDAHDLHAPIDQEVMVYLQRMSPTAVEDYQHARDFLRQYVGSSDTYYAYRRDVERFCHWVWLIRKASLLTMTRDDIVAFIGFVKQPPTSWISKGSQPRRLNQGGMNARWRPFMQRQPKHARGINTQGYQPSSAMIRATFAVLSSFYGFLIDAGAMGYNPISQVRQKKAFLITTQRHRVMRKLTALQWQTIIDVLKSKCRDDVSYHRELFIMSMFYMLGLRISELAVTPGRLPVMGDFFKDQDGCWWFQTIGKGNKYRDIAVPDQMLDVLVLFRHHLGLATPLPIRAEALPLLPKIKGQGGLGVRQIRVLVQRCFDMAITSLQTLGHEQDADDLQAATVHWLRHTCISNDIMDMGRPRSHVRDDAGHGNSQTTEQYIEDDRRQRHASKKHKRMTAVDDFKVLTNQGSS